MVLDIYELMLSTAKHSSVPIGVTVTFDINKKQSECFWVNKDLNDEHEELLQEWECEGRNTYKKRFLGIDFAIRFNHL